MIVAKFDAKKMTEATDNIVGKGPVYKEQLIDDKVSQGFGVAVVKFEKGTKLNWHTHPYEQIIYVTEGKGILATKTGENVVTPGSVVFIPAGEVHWHGATENSSFTHVAFYKGKTELSQT